MFKPGDKVVCVNNVSHYKNKLEPLNMYEIYIIKDVIPIKNKSGEFISIVPVGYLGMGFDHKRFVHLTEFRKQKIEKICLKLEKK